MYHNRSTLVTVALLALSFLTLVPEVLQAQSAGLLEYFVPGPEEQLRAIFEDMDNDPVVGNSMDAIITVAAAADSTTLYYDHWENGYNFDPDNPSSADEIWLLNGGQHQTFTNTGIFANPRNNADVYYDGGDRIYTVGGPVTLTRTSWPTATPTFYALSWEVYPNKLLNEDYIIPIGENLDSGPLGYTDFENTYLLLQATRDNTHVIVDDPFAGGTELDTTLAIGGYAQLYHINAGTEVHANLPIQVQFVVGRTWPGANSECRGFSAVPTAAWGQSYYCPVTSWDFGFHSDLYFYNPNSFAIDIDWEDQSGGGFVTLDANETRSLYDLTGSFLSEFSGTHVSSDNVFWGIGSAGTRNGAYDWGFGLVPAEYLTTNYHLGWAPSTWDKTADGSPVFVTAVYDSTTVWVDWSPADGTPDASWELDRLDVIRINDPDHDNSGLHIWGTRQLAAVWGEDANLAFAGDNYLDVGYAALPIPDAWMELVLRVECETTPASLPGEGGSSRLQVEVSSFTWAVDDPVVISRLPVGWDYIPGATVITLPDNTILTGAAADPLMVGEELWWQPLVGFDPAEQMHIDFNVQTNGQQISGQNEFDLEARGRWEDTHYFTAQTNSWVFIASSDSRIKPLYLREDSGFSLQRVPPGGDEVDLWVPEGGSANWELTPALSDTLHISGDINIPLYLYRSSPLYSPDVEVELNWTDGITQTIGTDQIFDINSGFYTFIIPAVDLILPPGATLELVLTVTEVGPGDRSVHLRYDGEEYKSRVVLATDTYLAVSSFAAYDAPWPEGQMASIFYSGNPFWLTTVATDPFGYADITSSSLGIPPVISSLPLAVVDEGANQRIFSAMASVAAPGIYTATDTTREGWEGTVEVVRDFTLTIIKTDLYSTLSFADLDGGLLEPGDTLQVDGLLFNSGSADATGTRNDLLLPAQLHYLSGSSSQGTIELAGDTLRLEPGTIVFAGDTVSYTFQARLDEIIDNNTLLQLQALMTDVEGDTVLSDNPLPNQWNTEETGNNPANPTDDDPLDLLISSETLLALICSVSDQDGDLTLPGDSLTYQLQLTNQGNQHLDDAAGILFSFPFPEYTIYRPGSAGSSSGNHWLSGDTLYWQGVVSVSDTIQLICEVNLEVPLFNGTVISTQAMVHYDATGTDSLNATALSDDPSTPTPFDPTNLTVTSAPLLQAALTVLDQNSLPTEPGDTLAWQLVIQNLGNATAADNPGSETLLPLPLWSTCFDWSSDVGTLELFEDTLRFNGELSPLQAVTLTFHTRLDQQIPNQTMVATQAIVYYDSSGNFSNDWQLLSDDPATPEIDDPTGLIISSAPALYAALTVADLNGAPAQPGDTLTWLLSLQNDGNDHAEDNPGPELLLPRPTWCSFTSWESSSGQLQLTGDTLEFNGAYPAGEQLIITMTTVLDQMIPDQDLVQTQAIVFYDSTGAGSNDWQLLSDNPATPAPQDPTGIQVNSTLQLTALLTVEEVIELRQAGSGWPRSGINPGELEQRNEPPQYYPGTELRWELQVGNAGSDLPTGLDWTLELPQELVDLQDLVFPLQAENLTDSSGGSWGNGLLRFRVDSLAFDETLTFSFQTTLDSGSVHDALVSCQAALNFDQLEEAMLSDSDPDSSGAQSTDLLVQRALLQGEAQLSAIDTDGNSVTPGDTLLLTLNWINHSSLTLSDVSYSESILPELPGFQLLELPPGAVDNSSDSGGDWGHGQIQIDGLQSEPGDTITCRWQLVVDTVPDSTVVSLQGELSSLSDLLLSDADNDSAGWQPLVLLLRNRPDLSATLNVVVNNSLATGGKQGLGNWFSRKQAPVVLDAEAAPGDRLWWDFQLQNSGTDLVEEVSLAVSLPDWLEDITVEEWSEQLTVIHLPDGGAYGNGQLVATATGLISGDSLEFSFATVIQTSIPDSTILITQGNVTTTALPDTVYSDGDGETPGVQPTEVLVLSPEGELAGNLQLSDLNGGHIQSGDTLRFVSHWENSHLYAVNELTYRHEIPPFTRLTRSGYLPAGALDSLAWSGGEFDRGLIQVTAFDLAGLQTDSLEYWLLVDSLLSQSVTDTTQARLQLADEIWLTDGDLETPGIQPTLFQLLADSAVETIQLQLTRTSTTPLWAGSSSVYELELINQGTGQLDGCSINLPLPDWAEEAAIIAAPTGSLQVEDSDLISAYNFSLAGGETATLELTLSISDLLSAGSIIELQGWCGTLLIPGPVMSNLLTETVQVAPPSITLTLSGAVAGYTVDPGGTVQAQDSLVYNFILTNSGGIQLDNIVLTDTLDNSLRYTGATSYGGTVDFNEGIITISNLNLAPGASLTGALYADIRDPVPLYTVISSQWTAQWDTLSVRSDADPLQPGEQPLNYTVEFAMQLPLLIWDNPARQREVRLVYHAPGANQVSLAVYDVLGERVRSFKNLPAGNGMTLVWHSDNDGGEALANGTYILILKVDDEITREKIALIR